MSLAIRVKRIFKTKSRGLGEMMKLISKIRGGKVCVDPIIEHQAANMTAIAKTLPTKLCIEFGSVSTLPAP